jgi:mannose-6-phosphate isomerase-like protein (cupin superfamily)
MLARKPKLGMIAGVLAVPFGAAPASMLMASPARLDSFETVDVAPRVFAYRMAGDYSQAGRPVDAPLVAVARTSVLQVMKQQVTVADYDRCVETIIYVVKGCGYSLVENEKVEWKAGDALYVPVWAWHRHFNTGDDEAEYVACENAPLLQNLGNIALREEAPIND